MNVPGYNMPWPNDRGAANRASALTEMPTGKEVLQPSVREIHRWYYAQF